MTNVGPGVTFPYIGDVKNPRNHRWSIGLQRELPWQLLIEITYVGAHGHNFLWCATERGAEAVLLHLAGSRQCDEQPADAAGAEPFAGLLAGTG